MSNRFLLPGLVAATFLNLLHYLAFSPLLPSIASDLRVEVGVIGRLPAAVGLGAAVIGLIAGPLADRFGKRRTLLLGMLAFVASATALGLLAHPAMLFFAALLAAAGRAVVYPLALSIATAEYAADDQRKAVSRISSSLGVAPIVGIPLVTTVAAAFDWRAAWLMLAAVTAVACVALWRVFGAGAAHRPADAQTPSSVRQLASAYGRLIKHPPSVALLGGIFLTFAGGWTVWTYVGAFLVRQHGFDTQQVGWAWAVIGCGLSAGTILAGGRLGRVPLDVLFTTAALGAGLCLGLSFILPLSGWLTLALIGVGTLLHGITQVANAVLLPSGAPIGRAATMTLRGAASSLGAAVGAAAGGVLLDGSGFATLGASAVTYCALAAALVWWSRGYVSRATVAPLRATSTAP